MSFILIPSRLVTPTVPKVTLYDEGVFCGSGKDAGLYAFRSSLGYIIANNFAPSLKVDGSVYTPAFSDVNGYIYWTSGSSFVYASREHGWVICSKFPGFEPQEYYDNDDKKYKGDNFWSGNIPSKDSSSSFSPRGAQKESGSTKKVEFYWERWQSDKMLGEYKAQGGASGEKIFGSPMWEDGSGVKYVRSVSKGNNGKYTYGGIYYVSGKWVIGTVGNPDGWWEGDEPAVGSSTTFKFTVPEDSEAKGDNIRISFKEYTLGDETAEMYLTEVALWR